MCEVFWEGLIIFQWHTKSSINQFEFSFSHLRVVWTVAVWAIFALPCLPTSPLKGSWSSSEEKKINSGVSWTVEVTYLSLYRTPSMHTSPMFSCCFCSVHQRGSCFLHHRLYPPFSWTHRCYQGQLGEGGRGGPCLLLWWQLSWPGWTNKYLCICMCVIVCVSVCICMCAHTCLCGHVQVCVNLCYYRTRKCVHEAKEKYIYRGASMCVCEFILLQIKTACS